MPGEVQLPVLPLLEVERFDSVVHTSGQPHAVHPVFKALRGGGTTPQLTTQVMSSRGRNALHGRQLSGVSELYSTIASIAMLANGLGDS